MVFMFLKNNNNDADGEKNFILSLERNMSDFLETKMSGKEKPLTIIIVSIILAAIIGTNLLTLTIIPQYFYAILILPAGLGVFSLLYYYLENKKEYLTQYREQTLQKRRIIDVIVIATIIITVLISLNFFLLDWFHTGIGATIAVVALLALPLMAIATEEETYYRENGMVDPREENNI
jgi:peptidoglycan biosynthesis protein MviN/MurJ (putative lipid II flippase)